LWQYVLGTIALFAVLEALVTRGRSVAPQVLVPTAILNTFIGFILYTAAQFVDDLQIRRARRKLERSLDGLDSKVQTDVDYDQRRELLDSELLRAEAMEILTSYEKPEDFWRDYAKVRRADPTLPAEVRALSLPAFDRFLRRHVEGQISSVSRQQRFNRLFLEAHEVFVGRNRDGYVLEHLNHLKENRS
jgi:hypothetical protein